MPRLRLPALCLFIASGLWAGQPRLPHPDHHEFEATLLVPYADPGAGGRAFHLGFGFPDAEGLMVASWRVEVLDAGGQALRTFRGETALVDAKGESSVLFDGRDAHGKPLAAGHYRVRLTASPMSDREFRAESLPDRAARVDYHLAQAGASAGVQEFDMEVGRPARPVMPAFKGLAFHRKGLAPAAQLRAESVAATGGLPYTVFLGNLHSQTNDSDGGGDVSTCTGAQNPQSSAFGPADAYQYALNGGLDLLMCSEHNHMFDGSTGTNASADPAAAHGRFAAGLSEAASFSAAHPGFLAIYGMEWGVISNGGHLNIFNADGLAEWETNSSGQLIGDYLTPKSDYPSLYAFMKSKGWVGQFNHPDTSGQFLVNGQSLGYSADGDEVMALCEVLNTSAFSHNTTETETSRSSYESAWKTLLERGYHVAPATDQDNHCANWGLSYHNRTGVLIPAGTPLTLQSFMDAVKARHVYATMDKTAQIVLTANGHIMGDRFTSSGPLALTVNYAAGSGQAASQVQIFEGVPGSNGTVTLTAAASSLTLTPSTGNHFYYAKITQADGDMLWSAPVWVDQQPDTSGPVSADITAPASDTTAASGAAVSFAGTGTTTGTGALSYAWNFGDGSTALGATASHAFTNTGSAPVTETVTLTVSDGANQATAFRIVTVTPAAGANTAPTLGGLPPQSTPPGVPLGPIAFTVGDVETPASQLTVTASSSDQDLLPDEAIVLGGSGANRTLTLNPVEGQTGAANVTVTVTDGGGLSTSATFLLTVQPDTSLGQGHVIISQYYEGAGFDKWIELTNVGNAPVNLAAPQLYLSLFSNAAADAPAGLKPNASQLLGGTLNPGQSILYKNGQAVKPAYAVGTTSTSVINFNGDDLVILTTTTDTTAWANRMDVVGDGDTWGQDTSFYRNPNVLLPNPTFTLAEWTQVTDATADNAAVGTSERLGQHLYNAPADAMAASITAPDGDLTLDSGSEVDFAGSGLDSNPGAAISYAWDFGDGNGGTGQSAAHTYVNMTPAAKTYTATLTVSDASGGSATASRAITVRSFDTVPPTATAAIAGWPAPALQGSLNLSASAQDNVGVTQVDFLVDGTQVGSSAGPAYAMAFDSATLADGAHALVARAHDAALNTGDSAPLSFIVDNQPPVNVACAVQGGTGTLTFSAHAEDAVQVSRVDFYLDGLLFGSSAAPGGQSFTLPCDSYRQADGTHALYAVAFDELGHSTQSATVAFAIANGPDRKRPHVRASVTGDSGVITLNAQAQDNREIAKVVFYVDGFKVATLPNAPYTTTLDSATLHNGEHIFIAEAWDLAGNRAVDLALFHVHNKHPRDEKDRGGKRDQDHDGHEGGPHHRR